MERHAQERPSMTASLPCSGEPANMSCNQLFEHRQAEAFRPEVVQLDFGLPGMNG